MVDILIVEDDLHKFEELEGFVLGRFAGAWVEKAVSVSSAIRAIDVRRFDLILLDMALPSHTLKPGNGPPSSLLSGGLEIIHEFDFSNRNEPIVILTQHPEIEIDSELIPLGAVTDKINELFSVNLLGCIFYEMGSDAWRNKLEGLVAEI